MELALKGTKAGDKLFVWRGHYDKGHIVTVDRVTPAGRVVTGEGTFDPRGYLRGESSGWGYNTHARPATEDDIAGIYRWGLVSKLKAFQLWEKLSPEDLLAAAAIIEKYKLPAR